MSLMNGLSAMGSGIAQFAQSAGLEQQRADLAMQQTQLAAQLQHENRTQEIAQQGTIQSGIVGQQTAAQEKVAGIGASAAIEGAKVRANAELGAAGIAASTSRANVAATIAANAPLVAAQAKQMLAQSGLTDIEQKQSSLTFGLVTDLVTEQAKPPAEQDQAKIATADRQLQAFYSANPQLKAAMLTQFGTMVRATQQEATQADASVARIMAQQQNLNMGDPKVRAEQDAELKQAQAQRADVYQRLHTMTTMMQATIEAGGQKAPAATPDAPAANRPPLGSLLRVPGATGGAATGPAPAASAPAALPGLINAGGPN